jgi:Domain of unknown function (DUF932)
MIRQLRAQPNESLTLEEMRARFPTIFAEQPHESRSSKYVYISTSEMLQELMLRDFLPVEAAVSRTRDESRKGYCKHLLRFRHSADLRGGGERRIGDTSFEVILRNAHDGTGSWQFMAGLLRLICLNGCVVSDGTVANVKVLHAGNRDRQLTQVVEGAFAILDQGPRVMQTIKHWQSIELNDSQRAEYADAAHTIRFADAEGVISTPILPSQLLHPRRYQDDKRDLWSTFNVVQENSVRGGLTAVGRDNKGRPRRSTTREVRGIDGDIRLNKALWQLTERTAERVE